MSGLVRHVAWQESLRTRTEGATDPAATDRASLRARARKGDARAKRALEGPPFPEALRYLWDWFRELARGLRRDIDGKLELSWVDFDAWARRTHIDPDPHEADALFLLVAVTNHPQAYMKRVA